ncbi:ISL3 family transposase [Haloglycomyces albus]|uniref:ISL3 family transposase n=1 Tax=Haloglycomyces albus TaxID=526067 RepID=UPI000A031E6F|nr:ISL3 family transposase [Haloglycomyces albus]
MKKRQKSTFVTSDSSKIVQALVGFKDVRVVQYERHGPHVDLVIEQVVDHPLCSDCGGRARVKERPLARYIDLPVYGQAMRLVWRKHRMWCPSTACPRRSWVLTDPRIAGASSRVTTRAAKWATVQVGKGRTVSEVATELGCDWHTINDAVTTYGGALLDADRKRLNKTTAIGLDETSFMRLTNRHTSYVTTVCDVDHHQIIDLLPSRDFVDVAAYINERSVAWKRRLRYGALDMSAAYAAVYNVMLPNVVQVVDAFHVVALTNRALDAVRRRVQHEQTGHRGRKHDPLYRARRVLLVGEERLTDTAAQRLSSLLALGDPHAEVAIAYRVKERIRDFYREANPDTARVMMTDLVAHCRHHAMPPELQRLGRTLQRWRDKICNYHHARVSNGPTEALNNLIKRIKRIGFGFTNFHNYRIRALLYAGKPNWRVLGSITIK